jgi:hypothetical protein
VVCSDDANFFIDYKWDTSFVLKKNENGDLIGVKDYMYVGGLLDIFTYNIEIINFNIRILNRNL